MAQKDRKRRQRRRRSEPSKFEHVARMPLRHLATLDHRNQGILDLLDTVRSRRKGGVARSEDGRVVTDWPDWCYIPLIVAQAHLVKEALVQLAQYDVEEWRQADRILMALAEPSDRDKCSLTALVAWRRTKGVYCLAPELITALKQTDFDDRIPVELLYRLPEWCCYVWAPGLLAKIDKDFDVPDGFFVHLDWQLSAGRSELRVVLDQASGLLSLALPLTQPSLSGALADLYDMLERHRPAILAEMAAKGVPTERFQVYTVGQMRAIYESTLAAILYLCSAEPDIQPSQAVRPGRNLRSSHRARPGEPRIWEVGWRVGAALRSQQATADQHLDAAETTAEGTGHRQSPRPHVRRAHWHLYWTGPRSRPEERRPELRWLPPVAVRLSEGQDLPATVRPVVLAEDPGSQPS